MSNHGHAKLSPSSAGRWLACPASVMMADSIVAPPGDSTYAAEGTSAHELGYLKAALVFGKITSSQFDIKHKIWKRDAEAAGYDVAEMEEHTDGYVSYLRSFTDDPACVFLERRVDCGVPTVWGTADAVITTDTSVIVVDLKYGQGVPVVAYDNPQLMLYALGALDEFGDIIDDTETVTWVIFQPRLDSISEQTMTADDLRKWRRHVAIPGAKQALGPDPMFNPSEDACRWCPAAGECKPRMLHVTKRDFGDPDVMTPEDIGEALKVVDEIKAWCDDVRNTAFQKAYTQSIPIPGWKVVLGSGRRYIVDEPKAIQALLDHGYPDVTNTKIKGFGDLDKMVGGKAVLAEILGDMLDMSKGSPALVPEKDPREEFSAIDSAVKDFG